MRPVVWRAQVRVAMPLIRHNDEFARPASGFGDAARPFNLVQRTGVTDIVNTGYCTLVGSRKRNGVGDVFNITACPAPAGAALAEQNLAARPSSIRFRYSKVR